VKFCGEVMVKIAALTVTAVVLDVVISTELLLVPVTYNV
jgi:hypothetical protein